MRRHGFIAIALAIALLGSGCAPQHETEQGILGGGLLGAGLGAIIGHATGHTGAGIAIGAASGMIAGGAIGNGFERTRVRADRQEERIRRQENELSRQRRELRELRQQQMNDDVRVRNISAPASSRRNDQLMYINEGRSNRSSGANLGY